MDGAIKWIEGGFEAMPLPLLELWGMVGYLLGFGLMICAFGGFTFRPGGGLPSSSAARRLSSG